MSIAFPFARPLYVMAKAAGPRCQLRCRYCYYLEKSALYDRQERATMSDALLETFTRQYIEAQTMPQVLFTWHGGEPLLRSIDFYRRALALQQRYARGRQIDNCLQTNGLLLDDEWCAFLAENHFLVGLSIDGPQFIHDHYRRDAAGRPTFERVMQAVRLLNKHGVEWNAMAVVSSLTATHPHAFYQFFKSIDCRYLQFTPIVERTCQRADGLQLATVTPADAALTTESAITLDAQLTPESVTPEAWGDFLCKVYDEWVQNDVGQVFVQLFDAVLANWVGQEPGICSLSRHCGHVAAMECNGDLYSCDHFVFPEYRLGNILQQPLTELMNSPRQQLFARRKTGALPRQCRECEFLTVCNGECPKNRFATDRYGQTGLNYLCAGYHRFFRHVAADMDFMASELRQGRAPANIMSAQKPRHE